MIRNAAELTAHGNEGARETLLAVAEHALDSVHPAALVPEVVSLDDGVLRVKDATYDLDSIANVYVFGAGKGSLDVVTAVRDRLPDAVDEAVAVEKTGQGDAREGVEVLEAGHPIPDREGIRASDRIAELARAAGPNDLVFACITGGASAQLPAPPEGVSLADLARLTRLLLRAGMPIDEINAVRKHVSELKGGKLAGVVHPATTVTLVTVDEVAGEPWGPTVPDETTFDDAVRTLKRRDLWMDVPDSVRAHLREGLERDGLETPDRRAFRQYATQTVVLADANDICEAAREKAAELGFRSIVLSTMMEGESAGIGMAHAGIAKEVARNDRPVERPCVVVSGGETTVSIDGDSGTGGPNQEFALRVAIELESWPRITALAIGTDGTDGPTDIAGGLVDSSTGERAERSGIDLYDRLRRHDAGGALVELDDAVYTGSTGTNLMDLRLLLVDDGD